MVWSPKTRIALGAALASGAIGLIVVAAIYLGDTHAPLRCSAGSAELGAHCCYLGQSTEGGVCRGAATQCPSKLQLHAGRCLAVPSRVALPGGHLLLRVLDWEPSEAALDFDAELPPFSIDATEVTVADWNDCVAAGACETVLSFTTSGTPVTNVSAEAAERYCRFRGGVLPTAEQWVFSASGAGKQRYPWGQTGLVCRRAVFGIVDGPCGTGAQGPDPVGTRPDGASATGIYDLVGNVAEWTREHSGYAARGGSFRSVVAGQLRVWSAALGAAPRDDIGFRCVYAAP